MLTLVLDMARAATLAQTAFHFSDLSAWLFEHTDRKVSPRTIHVHFQHAVPAGLLIHAGPSWWRCPADGSLIVLSTPEGRVESMRIRQNAVPPKGWRADGGPAPAAEILLPVPAAAPPRAGGRVRRKVEPSPSAAAIPALKPGPADGLPVFSPAAAASAAGDIIGGIEFGPPENQTNKSTAPEALAGHALAAAERRAAKERTAALALARTLLGGAFEAPRWPLPVAGSALLHLLERTGAAVLAPDGLLLTRDPLNPASIDLPEWELRAVEVPGLRPRPKRRAQPADAAAAEPEGQAA